MRLKPENEERIGRMTHQGISFVKSAIRILGYVAILFNIPVAVFTLVLSEVIGVVEEIGE